MDTPIIWTTGKTHTKINCRRLTKTDFRYYELSLIRTLTRSPYGVSYKESWLYIFQNNFKTISLKAINSTLTIQEIPRPTVYRIVVQTRRSSRPFFKGLSFLIHLTTRSSTLNPSPLLRKNWRLNYWVSMKTVYKSFHLRLFAFFSSIDVKQL